MITKEMSGMRPGHGEARTLRLKKYRASEVHHMPRPVYKRVAA